MTKPTQAQIARVADAIDEAKGKGLMAQAKAALTAAAEVGGRDPIIDAMINREGDLIAATIERCAQVADNCPAVPIYAARIIAAAIRALKAKP